MGCGYVQGVGISSQGRYVGGEVGNPPPGHGTLGSHVSKQEVRFLLECFLVFIQFSEKNWPNTEAFQ